LLGPDRILKYFKRHSYYSMLCTTGFGDSNGHQTNMDTMWDDKHWNENSWWVMETVVGYSLWLSDVNGHEPTWTLCEVINIEMRTADNVIEWRNVDKMTKWTCMVTTC